MDQKLIEFAMKQAGGEEQVKKAFYRKEMEAALKKAKTFEDMAKVAQGEEEWCPAVWALTRDELASLLGGGAALRALPTADGAKAKRSRLTKEEVATLRSKILEVLGALGDDEALSAGEIAEKVEADSRTVSLQIKVLREAGTVKMQGSRWSACYFLA